MKINSYPDLPTLAETVAEQFIELVDETLAAGRHVHIALTGGGAGLATLAAIGRSTNAPSIDWNAVHLWWGDERFLPDGDAERNETGARAALIEVLRIPDTNVHPMPALAPGEEASGPSLEQAASSYAAQMCEIMPWRKDIPAFDLVLLGMGPDAHIASLFPGQSTLGITDVPAAPVRNSPKPPPERITLTAPVLTAAENIWLLVAGADKRDAVAKAFATTSGTDVDVPVSLVAHLPQTTWFVDAAADPR